MAQITWKNINDAGQVNALNVRGMAVNAFNQNISDAFNVGANTLKMLRNRQILQDEEQARLNTAFVQNQLAQIQSPEQLAQMQQLGMLDGRTLLNQFGNKLDFGAINASIGALPSTVNTRADNINQLQDYLPKSVEARKAFNLGIATNNPYAAMDAYNQGNFSNSVTDTFGSDLGKSVDEERNRQDAFINSSFDAATKRAVTQEQLATINSAKSELEAQMQSRMADPNIIGAVKQRLGLGVGEQPTQEQIHEFLSRFDENYGKLLNEHTQLTEQGLALKAVLPVQNAQLDYYTKSAQGNSALGRTQTVPSTSKASQLPRGTKPTPVGESKEQRARNVYDAFRVAGFSHGQAAALTAEVGRENAYELRHLFGEHTDAANGKVNGGMISWQGARRNALINFMNERGLIQDGKIVEGQESLNAMAEFVRYEIENAPSYAATRERFLNNPNGSAEDYLDVLDTNYIRWARDQYPDHIAKQLEYYNLANSFDEPVPSLLNPAYDSVVGQLNGNQATQPVEQPVTNSTEVEAVNTALGLNPSQNGSQSQSPQSIISGVSDLYNNTVGNTADTMRSIFGPLADRGNTNTTSRALEQETIIPAGTYNREQFNEVLKNGSKVASETPDTSEQDRRNAVNKVNEAIGQITNNDIKTTNTLYNDGFEQAIITGESNTGDTALDASINESVDNIPIKARNALKPLFTEGSSSFENMFITNFKQDFRKRQLDTDLLEDNSIHNAIDFFNMIDPESRTEVLEKLGVTENDVASDIYLKRQTLPGFHNGRLERGLVVDTTTAGYKKTFEALGIEENIISPDLVNELSAAIEATDDPVGILSLIKNIQSDYPKDSDTRKNVKNALNTLASLNAGEYASVTGAYSDALVNAQTTLPIVKADFVKRMIDTGVPQNATTRDIFNTYLGGTSFDGSEIARGSKANRLLEATASTAIKNIWKSIPEEAKETVKVSYTGPMTPRVDNKNSSYRKLNSFPVSQQDLDVLVKTKDNPQISAKLKKEIEAILKELRYISKYTNIEII